MGHDKETLPDALTNRVIYADSLTSSGVVPWSDEFFRRILLYAAVHKLSKSVFQADMKAFLRDEGLSVYPQAINDLLLKKTQGVLVRILKKVEGRGIITHSAGTGKAKWKASWPEETDALIARGWKGDEEGLLQLLKPSSSDVKGADSRRPSVSGKPGPSNPAVKIESNVGVLSKFDGKPRDWSKRLAASFDKSKKQASEQLGKRMQEETHEETPEETLKKTPKEMPEEMPEVKEPPKKPDAADISDVSRLLHERLEARAAAIALQRSKLLAQLRKDSDKVARLKLEIEEAEAVVIGTSF